MDQHVELDGVVAAPNHHRVIFENDEVRVVETNVPAGDTTPVHTHPRTLFYVLDRAEFQRRDDVGNVMYDSRSQDGSEGQITWSQGTPPHVIQNLDDKPMRVIGVEIKG